MKNNKIISEILNEIKKLSTKNKFIVLFLWLSWIIDFSIFINEDFCVLFFSNLSSKTIFFMMFLYFFVVLIETLDIMESKNFKFNIIMFAIYFVILILILFKSLLFVKGFAWQFYLLMALFNFSYIIIKLNIIYPYVKNYYPKYESKNIEDNNILNKFD